MSISSYNSGLTPLSIIDDSKDFEIINIPSPVYRNSEKEDIIKRLGVLLIYSEISASKNVTSQDFAELIKIVRDIAKEVFRN